MFRLIIQSTRECLKFPSAIRRNILYKVGEKGEATVWGISGFRNYSARLPFALNESLYMRG